MTTIKLEIDAEELLACRICLATDIKLNGIHEHHLDEAFSDLMGTPLSVGDGPAPARVRGCSAALRQARALRVRCRRAHDLLTKSLSHQHYITTDTIRSLDRTSLQEKDITDIPDIADIVDTGDIYPKSLDYLDHSNDSSQLLSTLCQPDSDVEMTDVKDPNYIDIPVVEMDDLDDIDVKLSELKAKLEGKIKKEKGTRRKRVKKEKVRKRRKETEDVKEVKDITFKEEKPSVEWWRRRRRRTKKKKGFKRYFMCDEDYAQFEERYNIEVVGPCARSARIATTILLANPAVKQQCLHCCVSAWRVVRLSEEEQQREMEARKESENYLHALVRCEKCFKGSSPCSPTRTISRFTTRVFPNLNRHKQCRQSSGSGPERVSSVPVPLQVAQQVRTHLIECHQLKYVCKECKLVIRGRYMAVMHAQFHAGKTWECKHCPLTFKKQSTFYTHLRINHSTENALGGTCDICGETFTGAMGLRMHKTQTHNKKEIKALKCLICKIQFENKDALDRHYLPDNDCDPKLR
ncbi:hypothetical protein MSG28_016151 [Choristoneura fumiferana]|uniref:Uncharacterized protein n=1 Tax=Choristoneura fumiferana TaxID=7141 RepID=A0ACC0K5Z7_CHOFU|nr:hypothetical protein MSG28_016151 [Choristoneura fumiferana]